jgi:hypothetical protein
MRVTREVAFCTLLCLLSTKWKDVTTVTAPIGTHVGEILESMRNAMVELGLVWIGFGVGLRDTFGDHFRITLLVASVVTV